MSSDFGRVTHESYLTVMRNDFRIWLVEYCGLKASTAANRAANISSIEKYYDDIDTIMNHGNVKGLLRDLSYSTDDERADRKPRHNVPICGNIRTGSATLKQAVARYIEFYQARGLHINGFLQ